MRITRSMMFDSFLNNLQRLNGRTARAHRQLTAGRKVLDASDDPVAAGRIQSIAARLAALERLDRSAQAGRSSAEMVETALSGISLQLTQARVLAVTGGTTQATEARNNLATEVESIREQIIVAIAVQKDGRYLTSGTQTDVTPFDTAGVYQGNASALTAKADAGGTVVVAPTAAEILQGSVDVLATLEQLATDLRNDDLDAVRGAITSLDTAIDHLSSVRGRIGAAIQRIDGGRTRRLDLSEQLLVEASELSRTGLPEILVDLAQAENAREATLAAGARISGPTLFDFLR